MFKRKANSTPLETTANKRTNTSNNNSEPWKLVFNDARQAFSENKFKDAVALFTRALVLNPNHTTLLDCRAACYEKLEELDLALKDASTIVKVAPNDARGYLRAGKILSLQKKYEKAIHIYTRALKKVDPTDARYAMISNMKELAEKALKPPSKHDMMTKLPYDIISLVFSYLSFDRRIQCTAVSKSWRNFAVNWSGMWRDLEFGNRKVSMNIIKRYLGYAQGRHVRSFSIHFANRNTVKNILQSLIDENCQYIECLDLKGCEIPVDIFARMLRLVGKHVVRLQLDQTSLSTSELLQTIIPMCPNITHLSILGLSEGRPYDKEKFQPLDRLVYLRCDSLGEPFVLSSKHLTCLDFHSSTIYFWQLYGKICNTHKDINTLHFSYGHPIEKTPWMYHAPRSEKGITTFSISLDRFFSSQVLESFLIENPNIQDLTILGCDLQITTGLVNHIQHIGLPNLQKLSLQHCHSLTEEELHIIITKCLDLEQVYIPKMLSVVDKTLLDFATFTKKLKILDISDCNTVTGVGIQALVRAHKTNLEKLILNNCQRINPDAIHWATQQLGKRVVECKFRVK